MDDPLVGEELEHYRLDRMLGQGGMGVVYQGTDMALGRSVAIKVLPPRLLDDRTARARFQKEINAAVAIEHPHVVPIYGAGYDKRHFFLVMRLIDGPDLARELRSTGPFSEDRTMRLIGQIASALHAVHARNLVHRDVKPQNVLIGACGERDEHAVLTDFGIAKALDESVGFTRAGPIGTPLYMAPEVVAGGTALPASDQYSLAVMAYEMLTGQPPFGPDSDLMHAHQSEQPEPLRTRRPDVSRAIASAIERGLEKRPELRFPDVRDLASADHRSRSSFEQAEEVSEVLAREHSPEGAARTLTERGDLSDAAIATVTELSVSTVARVRRRAAREALVGRTKVARRRDDGTRRVP